MNHPKPTIVELLAELGIPRNEAIHDIVDRIEAAYREANTPSVKVGWNEDGTIDEVFSDGPFHMEQLDDNVYWFGSYRDGVGRFSWNLFSTSPIEARVQDFEACDEVPENAGDRWPA